MKLLQKIAGIAVGIALASTVGASLFAPVIPSNNYLFVASNGGCEVGAVGRQSAYSVLQQIIAPSEAQERAVRMFDYVKDEPGAYGFGTGFLLGGEFVLTAGHVVDDMENAKVMTGDGAAYRGRVVGIDSVVDIALLKAPSFKNNDLVNTTIGDVKRGEEAAIVTLDTHDVFYVNGVGSHRLENMVRYDPSEAQKQMLKLVKQREALEVLKNGLYTQMERVLHWQESTLETENETGEVLMNGEENPARYLYVGKTGDDQFIPGMSGSGMVNKSGKLVGIAITHGEHLPTPALPYMSSSGRGFGLPEDTPQDTIKKLDVIASKIGSIEEEISGLQSEMYRLFSPAAYGAVSPEAIVSFLEKMCESLKTPSPAGRGASLPNKGA